MRVVHGLEAQPAARISQGWPVFKSDTFDKQKEDARTLVVFCFCYCAWPCSAAWLVPSAHKLNSISAESLQAARNCRHGAASLSAFVVDSCVQPRKSQYDAVELR